jgi:GxxExxY protein
LNYLYEDLTYKIIGCAFDVFKTLGAGYDETIYHKAFAIELEKQGFDVKSKIIVPVVYREKQLLDFEIDLMVNDLILLELKEVQSNFLPIHYNQIISYLKATKKRLGYLFNFGLHKVFYDRILFDEKEKKLTEEYDEIKNLSDENKLNLRKIRSGVISIYNELGLGYDYRVYQEALKFELNLMGLKATESVPVNVDYEGKFLKEFEIKFWLIDDQLLIAILAGSGEIRAYDIVRMRSYLRRLDLETGIIIFWGKDGLKILGVGKYKKHHIKKQPPNRASQN